MTFISLRVSSELSERLSRLAGTHGLTTQECAVQALLEYVENWEGFNRAMYGFNEGLDNLLLVRIVFDFSWPSFIDL